jgi:diguanylate cyclase (GGDEF)-like protein/PAS domain S-box-containing protein
MPLRVLTSLKSRLALAGALLIATSVLIGATAALNLVDVHINDALLDGEAAQARTLARVASNRLVARQAILRRLSEDLPPAERSGEVLAWLRGKTVLLSSFDTLFVTLPDGQGVALASADGVRANEASLSLADRPYFQRTLQQRTPQISDPVTSRISGLPTIIFTQPVLARDGSLRAVLGASLRLSSRDLLLDLTDDDRSDESGHVTAIIDRAGRLIAHADPTLVLQPAERDPHLAVAIATWRANGAPFAIQGQSWRSDGHYVGLAGIPAAEWFVVRAIDEERVLGGVAHARRRAIALMLTTALLGGGALWAATYWLMRPFDRLKRRAAAMSVLDGDGAHEPWPTGGEIGSLARVLREVEQRNRASVQERAQLLRQMNLVLEHAAVGLLVTIDRKMVLVSGALGRLFGYEPDELTGQPARILFPSDEIYDALGPQVAQAFAEQGQFDDELRFVRRDGSLMWGRLVGRPVEPDNPGAGTIWVVDDVGALREQRERLEWASTHDSLTGLANRAAFERALDRQLADRRVGTPQRPFCVMALDLDYFKAVNDRGGHAAGDALLQDLSSLMGKRLRRSDLLARLGGDEFGALLVNCDEATALKVADSMREQVAQYRLRWQGEDYSVGISIGVVEVDARHADRAAAMRAADQACYEAKGAGRNQVRAAARS